MHTTTRRPPGPARRLAVTLTAAVVAATGLSLTPLAPPAQAEAAEPFTFTNTYAIATGNDDAMANGTRVNLTSSGEYLHGAYSSTLRYDNYLRFTGVELPADAVIQDASIDFTVRDAAPDPSSFDIYAETGLGAAFTSEPASFDRTWNETPATWQTTPMAVGDIATFSVAAALIDAARQAVPERTDYVFKIVGLTPEARFVARSYNGSAAAAPQLTVTYTSANGRADVRVAATNDDAEEYGAGNAIALENSMEIGGYWGSSLTAGYKEIAGFRFPSVDLPEQAEITDAHIEFTVDDTGPADRTSDIVIRSELGDAAAYTTQAGSISARSYTNQSVTWTQDSFTETGVVIRTPNLASVIDENRVRGWENGNAMAFMLDGDDYIGAVYPAGAAQNRRARLVIDYVAGQGPSSSIVTDPSLIDAVVVNEAALSGDKPWVELYNGSTQAVLLDEDFSLSDTADDTTKGVLDNVYIPAQGFAIVYLDGSTGAGSTGYLADPNAAAVTLARDGDVVSTLESHTTRATETVGRFTDGAAEIVTFTGGGTPGSSNDGAATALHYVVTPASGVYDDPFEVTIDADFPATVHYTLDGSDPDALTGTPYTGPIAISEEQTQLKVFVDAGAGGNSGVVTYSYWVGLPEAATEQKATSRIATGDDDAMANESRVNLTSSGEYLDGSYSSSLSYDNYLRFTGVTLPTDAIVTDARIVWTMRDNAPSEGQLAVSGETGPGNQLTSQPATYAARSFTSPVTMTTPVLSAGATYTSDNIASIVTEMFAANANRSSYVFKVAGLTPDVPFVARSYNGSAALAPTLELTFYSTRGSSTTATTGNDDVEEYGTNDTIARSGSLQIGGYYSTSLVPAYQQSTGFRFPAVTLPQDATLTNAYIEFTTYADGGQDRTSHMTITSELGDAPAYTTTAGDLSNREYTATSVDWTATSFTENLGKVRTPDLSSIIDENRLLGWQDGQAMAFRVDGDNFIGGVYEGSAVLRLEYSFEGPGMYRDAITDPALITDLAINEVSTEGTLADEDDWIELYNGGTSFVVLDDGVRLWREGTSGDNHTFDNLVVPPGAYRILHADEKPDKGNDHLDFDLKKKGTLTLAEPSADDPSVAGRVIDSFTYGEQVFTQTHARKPDGAATIALMAEETYGFSNDEALEKYAITFDHDRGVYPTGFDLVLTGQEGTTIRYTLDGTTPTADHGIVYEGTITIAETCVVRAISYDANGTSTPATNTYVLQDNLKNEQTVSNRWRAANKATIDDAIYAEALAALPVVSISSDTEEVSHSANADYVPSYFEFIPEVGSTDEDFASYNGVKRFGQVSASQFNSGIAVRFKKDYGAGKAKYAFFEDFAGQPYGLSDKQGKLELHEGQDGPQSTIYNLGDNRYDEMVTRRLSNEMGIFDSHVRYVNYFYNGEYMGIKSMREDFGAHTFDVYFDIDNDEFTKVSFQDAYFRPGNIEEGDGDEAILDLIQDVVASRDLQEAKKYIDIDNYIRNHILFMFIDTENEFNGIVQNNVADGGMRMMFNVNDSDGAFYNNGNGSATGDPSTTASGLAGGGGTYRYKWLYNTTSRNGAGNIFNAFSGISTTTASDDNLEFRTIVKDRVLELIGEASGDFRGAEGAPLSVDNVTEILKQEQATLDVPYRLDAAFMADNANIYQDWLENNAKVLNQVNDRVAFNLERWAYYGMTHTLAPVTATSDEAGSVLTSADESVAIFYTLDGSDPLGANGAAPGEDGANPSALVYQGETLPVGATITARAHTTGNWGPLTMM
ncbi:MAG: chitobiase/beta-hexosaminidase C-terminal domain-containing protein [Propionibacteriaceae bacterium]|jgi:hypothetical protein|nr:chitobiase/beta-hexosaminidase C-terminal domain-containing protein [Propionibacteriaceae bacterium]